MSLKIIVEKIIELEKDYDLFNIKIDNVYFWELIRFNIFSEITQKTKLYTQSRTKLNINATYVCKFFYKAFVNFFCKNPFFLSQSVIVFLGHPRRKLCEDGQWWDVYCDPVIDALSTKYKQILLETSYLNTHLVPQKTSCISYLDFPNFLGTLLRRLRIVNVKKSKKDTFLLCNIQERIVKDFGVKINLEKITYQTLAHRKSIMPIYKYILNKINPKVAVLVVSYGNEVFIESCKDLCIPTIELQHGTFSQYHLGYSYSGGHAIKRLFPDYFFAFGDYWKNLIELPINGSNVVSVGYPFFEQETLKYQNELKKNQVIFISQGVIGEKLSRFAVEFQNSCSDYDVIYKLHPGEYHRWRESYPWLADAQGIQVIDNETGPLYRLLAQSKAQVGVFSTLIYEGLGMGLPTFLLDLPGIEYMDHLVDSNIVSIVCSVDDLVVALSFNKSKPIIADDFFKSDSLNNILINFKKIIQY